MPDFFFVLLFTIFIIVVTQKLVLQLSKNVTAKCTETYSPLLVFYSPCRESFIKEKQTVYSLLSVTLKVIMQRKLIAVVYTLCSVYILKFETSSLWAEFVNKNRCISVFLVSEEDKGI